MPPSKFCMVCGDKALGYNFNAITCESCKAFFRRNALAKKEHTCPFNHNCEITVVTRRFCQKCRLQKCFDIGMKSENIMSEEDKIIKKKKIEQNRAKRKLPDKNDEEILEKIKREETSVNSVYSESINYDGNVSISNASCDSQSCCSFESDTHTQSHINECSAAELVDRLVSIPERTSQIINILMKTPKEAVEVMEKIINSPAEAMRLISHLISYPGDALKIISKIMNSPFDALTVFTKFMSSPTDALDIISKIVSSPQDVLQFVKQLMNSPERALEIMNKFMNTPAEALKMINRMVNGTKEISTKIEKNIVSDLTVNTNECVIISSMLSNSQEPTTMFENPVDFRKDYSSPATCDLEREATRDIQSLFEQMAEPSEGANSLESVLYEVIRIEYQTSLPQTCSGNRELNEAEQSKLSELKLACEALYYPLDDDLSTLLIDEERMKTEGTQDPQLLKVINLTAVAIRRLIKMSKKITAFRNMCQEDQVALLKGGCTEMMIMRSVMSYDCDRATWKIPHSQEDMSNIKADVLKLAKGNVYEEHERFIRTFDPKWRMDENIILIMCAIVLFTPTRLRVIHSDVIKLEQNSYYYLLRRYLESVYPGCEAKSTFIKLIQKISEVERLNQFIIGVYLNVNPSQIEPLLREIFDLKNH